VTRLVNKIPLMVISWSVCEVLQSELVVKHKLDPRFHFWAISQRTLAPVRDSVCPIHLSEGPIED